MIKILYPLFFYPIHKERIWGSQKLAEKYNRDLPSDKIGESWEIACHDNGTGLIRNGPLTGISLLNAIEKYGEKLLGSAVYDASYRKFPLLIKILDAADVLSVQVHPDDDYANIHENGELGKTEMWYVIDAVPDAKLVYGVKPGVTRETFRLSLEKARLEECLQTLEVKAGDVLYIPAGLVHAIGAGIMICEIQQNSDTTYRVYDWNRVDDKGSRRELHIEKALEVIDFDSRHTSNKLPGLELNTEGGRRILYIACDYFAMEKLIVDGAMDLYIDGKRFQTLTCIEGSGKIHFDGGVDMISSGGSCLIPASLNKISVEGNCTLIRAYVPDKQANIIQPLLKQGYRMEGLTNVAGLFD